MLTSLADGADLLLTGMSYQELAANVAEYRDIPLATLLWFPIRVNGHVISTLPAPVIRSAMTVYEWLVSRGVRRSKTHSVVNWAYRRLSGLHHDESQHADRWKSRPTTSCAFPGWQHEWAKWDGQRPFVGTLTLELPTAADDEVSSWIAAGNTADLFRVWQHPGRILGRHDRHDRRGLRAVRRAGVGLRRRN